MQRAEPVAGVTPSVAVGNQTLLEQQAILLRLEAGKAWVSVGGRAECPACAAGQGCGAGIFGRLLAGRPEQLCIPVSGTESAHLEPGSTVIIGLPTGEFLRLVLLNWGLPLGAILAGAVLGHAVAVRLGASYADIGTLAGAVALLLPAWRWRRLWAIDRLARLDLRLRPATLECAARGLHVEAVKAVTGFTGMPAGTPGIGQGLSGVASNLRGKS